MQADNDDSNTDVTLSTPEGIKKRKYVRMAFSVASDVGFVSAAFLVVATDHKLVAVGCFLLSRWLTKASSWMSGSLDTLRYIDEEMKTAELNTRMEASSQKLQDAIQKANSALLRSKFMYPWRL